MLLLLLSFICSDYLDGDNLTFENHRVLSQNYVEKKINNNVSHIIFKNVIQVDDFAFFRCFSLKLITFTQSPKTIICRFAFSQCKNLQSLIIPNFVILIGDYTFSHCDNLVEVTFLNQSTIKSLGNGAFFKCVKLKNIMIPESVEEIHNNAFACCYQLKSVNFSPKSKIRMISNHLFYDCYELISLTLYDLIPIKSIFRYAFFVVKILYPL